MIKKIKNKKVLVLLLLVTIVYCTFQWRQHQQIERMNDVFDPEKRGFKGRYVPWPLGPYIIGSLTGEEVSRIKELNSGSCIDGTIFKENLKLIVFDSDGHFIIHFE